jgi:hypothetical protein
LAEDRLPTAWRSLLVVFLLRAERVKEKTAKAKAKQAKLVKLYDRFFKL